MSPNLIFQTLKNPYKNPISTNFSAPQAEFERNMPTKAI